MKILVIGGGGREHALAWKLAQSPLVEKVYCAPGNAGIANTAERVNLPATDISALADFAKSEKVDLTVVGPEAPLVAGVVDAFAERKLRIFGPNRKAAAIEGSKVFAKKLMHRHAIPTASFRVFDSARAAHSCVHSMPPPLVVKADGLAAGKGAIVCRDAEAGHEAVRLIMEERAFGDAGNQVIVEECLTGEETSILALTDGKAIIPLLPAQDHKTALDGDTGPNTGGMGAYVPAFCVTPQLMAEVEEKILVRTIHALNHERRRYQGVLYAGLMLTPSGPQVLEYNARFGDPETQPIMMLLKSDLAAALMAAVEGKLGDFALEWHEGAAVCVVMASAGYPGGYAKGKVIEGLECVADMPDVQVFHSGSTLREGHIVTNGGRVLGVTARGKDVAAAIATAYAAVSRIGFEGAHYRKDIGAKALHKFQS